MYVCICVHMYVLNTLRTTLTDMYVYICIYVCICMYMYVCVYVCMYVYVCYVCMAELPVSRPVCGIYMHTNIH
jgi:hypothetical protein